MTLRHRGPLGHRHPGTRLELPLRIRPSLLLLKKGNVCLWGQGVQTGESIVSFSPATVELERGLVPVISSTAFGGPFNWVPDANVDEGRESGGDLSPGKDHVRGGGDGEVAGICEAGVSLRSVS